MSARPIRLCSFLADSESSDPPAGEGLGRAGSAGQDFATWGKRGRHDPEDASVDLLGRLPLFSRAIHGRLVFVAAFALAILAALGADAWRREPGTIKGAILPDQGETLPNTFSSRSVERASGFSRMRRSSSATIRNSPSSALSVT